MTIIVRPALTEELPRVNAMRAQVNRLHCEGRPDIFRPGFCEALQAHVYDAHERGGVLVALEDGELTRYAMIGYLASPTTPHTLARRLLPVEVFGVDEDHRRQGVATALVDYMKREARTQGVDRIELDVWEFNESARRFYEAAGFQVIRRFLELPLNDPDDHD